jgi:hypothetical protein
MSRNTILKFLGSGLCAGLVSHAAIAKAAWWKTFSATQCVADEQSTIAPSVDPLSGQVQAVGPYPNALDLVCPVSLESYLYPADGETLTVSGWATVGNTAEAVAAACRTYYQASGGACGSFAVGYGPAVYHLQPDTSVWNAHPQGQDGFYVRVNLRTTGVQGYGGSVVWGYQVVQN